jgi:hypothetical protein
MWTKAFAAALSMFFVGIALTQFFVFTLTQPLFFQNSDWVLSHFLL